MKVFARELEEALDGGLLAADLLRQLARVLGGEHEEVLEAALRIVRQRIDAHDVLLADGDPHRRAALGERAGAADGGHDDLLLRRDERGRQQPVRGQAHVELEPAVDADVVVDEVLERLAPDVEHRVGADEGISQRAGLLGEEVFGLGAILGGGQVEVQRDAHQLVLADGLAGAPSAMRDVGLDRPEVLPAVEDHGQCLGEAQRRDSQGDGGRGPRVDQRSLEQVVCVFSVHLVRPVRIVGVCAFHHYRLTVGMCHRRLDRPSERVMSALVGLIYKPFGILLGVLAGLAGKRLFNFAWTKIDDADPPKPTTEVAPWAKVLGAAALQGVIFRVTRVTVDRYGAIGWRYLTGVWPGEKRPDPDE